MAVIDRYAMWLLSVWGYSTLLGHTFNFIWTLTTDIR